MHPILSEIREIPARAQALLTAPIPALPLGVPYLGMGSSYFAPLAFKYMGLDIRPEIASEYYNYLTAGKKEPLAVILSQSGRSSEALWCTELFEQYVAVTNYPENALGNQPNVRETVAIGAGDERFSSSKTYVNTLLALFCGFGIDPRVSVDLLVRNFDEYEAQGKALADAFPVARAVFDDLLRLARRVGCRHPVLRFEVADLLGALEALGEQEDERGVDVVDAAAQPEQGLLGVFGHAILLTSPTIPAPETASARPPIPRRG